MFRTSTLNIFLGLSLALAASCKPRQQELAQVKDANPNTNGSRQLTRVDPGPSLPPAGRSLFDLLLHRSDNPAGRDQVPYPFETLREFVGGAASTSRNPNAETKKTSAVLVPVGRSIQRFASEPDYFRNPRILLSPTSWYDDNDGTPLSIESKLFIGFAPPADQLEIISYNEQIGRYEFQIVENYGKDQRPTLRYADRSLCVSCHQNQGPIFSSEPWNDTNANIAVASLIAAANGGKETYHGANIRQTEADTDSGVSDSFALNDRVDDASESLAVNLVWAEVDTFAQEDPIAYRAKLLAAMLKESLNLARTSKEMIADLDQRIAKVSPTGLPITDGIFATRNVLHVLYGSTEGREAAERFRMKDADFLFDGTPASRDLLATLTTSIRDDLKNLPSVGMAIGAGRTSETGDIDPPVLFDADTFFGAMRGFFYPYGMKAVRDLFAESEEKAKEEIDATVQKMAEMARNSRDGFMAGKGPFTFYKLMAAIRRAKGLPPTSLKWIDDQTLPPPLGPADSTAMSRDQITDPSLRRVYVFCDSCHRVERDGVPGFLSGASEAEVLSQLGAYKKRILERLAAPDDSVMPPQGTMAHAAKLRFPEEFAALKKFLTDLP